MALDLVFKAMSRETIVKVLVAFGLVALAFETRFMHRDVVRETWIGWIPTVASAIGVIVCVLALSKSPKARGVASVIFALLAACGLVGEYYHTGFQPQKFLRLLAETGKPTIAYADDGKRDEGEKGDRGGGPPALAPLGLTGLCLIGAAVSWPKLKSGGS